MEYKVGVMTGHLTKSIFFSKKQILPSGFHIPTFYAIANAKQNIKNGKSGGFDKELVDDSFSYLLS